DLSENNLHEIPPNAFYEQPSLNALLLNLNSIELLHTGSFAGLTELVFLEIQNNKISNIPGDVFPDSTGMLA
ncbi:hypothetical protein BSL78_13402, partial [Apostichopus japonicus]